MDKEATSYRSVGLVSFLTLLSRVTGLFRETTRAYFLGTGVANDAFQVAFQLPNLLRRLVGEGVISSILVPVFSQYATEKGATSQRILAEKFLTLWCVLVAAITFVGVVFGGRFVILAFRWGSFAEEGKRELTAELTTFLFWYLSLVGITAALQGILNARKYFAVPAMAPLLFNVAFVALAWAMAPFCPKERQVFVLAGAVLLGGFLQLAVMIPLIWRLGIRPRPRWPLDHREVRQVLRLFGPAVFGAGIYQINVFANMFLAGRLEEEGSVSFLGYSNRLMEFVLGVFVFALSTVSLTSLSRQIAAKDFDSYAQTLAELLRMALFITLPSAVGLYFLRKPVLSLIYESGDFDAISLERTARTFQFHILGLCFVGLSRLLVNGFYAMKNVGTPVRIATICLFINVAVAWRLSEGELSYVGIALASSAAAVIQTVLLWRAIGKRVPQLDLRRIYPTIFKTTLAAAVMGAAIWAASLALTVETGKVVLGAQLAGVIIGGAGVFFLSAKILGMSEVDLLFRRILRSDGK